MRLCWSAIHTLRLPGASSALQCEFVLARRARSQSERDFSRALASTEISNELVGTSLVALGPCCKIIVLASECWAGERTDECEMGERGHSSNKNKLSYGYRERASNAI